MEEALKEAEKSFNEGEIPVGAVIVKDGKIIAKAHNLREKSQIATHHAEILAIQKACKKLKSWRLDDCDIFVTLEPCPMCCGAIANARIKNLFYAAEEKTSEDKLMQKILSSDRLNHKVNVFYIENKKASSLLTDFFKNKRKS